MNLVKAIEILESYQADLVYDPEINLVTAIKLGIEALKRLQELRRYPNIISGGSLPGETIE